MNTPSTHNKVFKGSAATGLLLILIGSSWLLFQLLGSPILFPLFLGASFLAGGSLTRKAGLIIPGGIVGGIGLGILAVENSSFAAGEPASGGLFMAAFALGWFSITLFTRLFTAQTEWWPLIPGGIIALFGSLLLMGQSGLSILQFAGQYWPVSLVVVGAVMLVKHFRGQPS